MTNMATARVPLLDLTGHLPDSYAPPSVAIDAQTATTKAGEALASANAAAQSETNAGQAKTDAESARDLALGYRDTAASHAGTATTKAGEAAASAATAANKAAARDALPVTTATVTVAAADQVFLGMDSSGRVFRTVGTDLQRSTDDGATWTSFHTFPRYATGVRQLDNGELLVGVADDYPANTVKAQLYLSSGYAGGSPTFASVLTADDYQQALALRWGFGGAGATYVVSEYDSKAPGARSAIQRCWLTQDSGATWTAIYDHGTGSVGHRHMHGCTYDPWRGAIWLTTGDYLAAGDGNRKILVSWNLGSTWTVVTTQHQPTTVEAFPECVVFGTDGAPNGILRIDNPSPTSLVVKIGYRITGAGVITHVAGRKYRAAGAGSPLIIPFQTAAANQSGLVLASTDGFAWYEMWRDTRTMTATSKGPDAGFGPTTSGAYVISGSDEAGGTNRFTLTLTPGLPGVTSALANVTRHLARAIPRRAYACLSNDNSQVVSTATWTEVKYGANLFARDDPSDLFTRATSPAEGIIVNRDAIVRIAVDGAANLGTWGSKPQAAIAVNGVRVNAEWGRSTFTIIPVTAGQRISGFTYQETGSDKTVTGVTYALMVESYESY